LRTSASKVASVTGRVAICSLLMGDDQAFAPELVKLWGK
jgi:hypothetical protein